MNKLKIKDGKYYLDGLELELLSRVDLAKLSGRRARLSLTMVVGITDELELPTGQHWSLSVSAQEGC